jgi:hypothetical protein
MREIEDEDEDDGADNFDEPVLIQVDEGTGEATLGESLDDLAASLGDVTWRELIEDCLHGSVKSHADDLEEWLEESFGISSKELDETIDEAAVDRYYTQLCYRQDNRTGSNVGAFDFIRSLELFPTDADGNGSSNGVILERTTANGPRKGAYILDRNAANWLVQEAARQGVVVKVRFG